MKKDILIIDCYGTLLSISKNEHFMSPLIKDRLLTEEDPIIAPYVERSLLHQKDSVSVFEDTYDFLKKIGKKYHLICMSNLSHHFIECFYTWKLDEYIHETLFSCQHGIIKPQPIMYYKVLKKYPGTKVYMIGDSYNNDYLVPRTLGIEAYWLNREGIRRKINPEHQALNLTEFHKKIEK